MRPRSQVAVFGSALPFRFGAAPSVPVFPWQTAQPLLAYSFAPSVAVPRPGGSSAPVGPMEMSHARISSAVGVRPTPYVGPCASAVTPIRHTNGRTLSMPIVHAPIAGDSPRLNAVVQPRHSISRLQRDVPV